ncbi:hypothetical protein HMPREF9420_0323 [Segatella salivae DSM 15606]|uniref:Uncharacterized protein n=1 Tax=Segatella salivae DSM 15606 TaxID=888832 RepID=E6MLF6_9BACT|nr:hypothetical protein HMPREF9420_0323 [Segatella salivae DSM 15606]
MIVLSSKKYCLMLAGFSSASYANFLCAKLLQKSEMRKDIVIELSYKGFG